mmetsp:Transcript_3889/g.8784  ORF Transcript_3889/g.8784 Transcript_3889/m.8784 type:complete len:249 (-) Transcript_3889:357-1103(-)
MVAPVPLVRNSKETRARGDLVKMVVLVAALPVSRSRKTRARGDPAKMGPVAPTEKPIEDPAKTEGQPRSAGDPVVRQDGSNSAPRPRGEPATTVHPSRFEALVPWPREPAKMARHSGLPGDIAARGDRSDSALAKRPPGGTAMMGCSYKADSPMPRLPGDPVVPHDRSGSVPVQRPPGGPAMTERTPVGWEEAPVPGPPGPEGPVTMACLGWEEASAPRTGGQATMVPPGLCGKSLSVLHAVVGLDQT